MYYCIVVGASDDPNRAQRVIKFNYWGNSKSSTPNIELAKELFNDAKSNSDGYFDDISGLNLFFMSGDGDAPPLIDVSDLSLVEKGIVGDKNG